MMLSCKGCGSEKDFLYERGDDSVGINSGLICDNCEFVDFTWADEDQYWDEVNRGLREVEYV